MRPLKNLSVLKVLGICFATFLVFYFFVLPILAIAFMSIHDRSGFTIDYLHRLIMNKNTYKVLFNTLYINILSSFFSAVAGVFAAYIVAYTDIPGKNLIHSLLLLPLIIPGYIITLGWMQFFAKGGFFISFLDKYFPNAFVPNIYSYAGIIFVFTVTKFPLIYLIVLSTFRKIGIEMEQSAQIFGLSKTEVFWHVNFPLAMSGFANGLLLVFLSCLDNFGTVSFLGIPANITVLSTDIYQSVISLSGSGFSMAAGKSVILGIFAVVVSFLLWNVSKNSKMLETCVESNAVRVQLGIFKIPVLVILWAFLLVVLLVPVVTLVYTSFITTIGAKGLSLDNYRFIFTNAKCYTALKNSLILGLSTVLICFAIGTVISYLLVKKNNLIAKISESFISIPYALPGIVIGLSIILVWGRRMPVLNISIYGTIFILLISYIIRFSALQIKYSTAGFLQLDDSMIEAGKIYSSSRYTVWKEIILPLVAPSTLSGMALVFINVITEMTTSSLLWSGGSETIGVVIFNFTSAGFMTKSCALSTVVMILILAGYIAGKFLFKTIKKAEV